MSPSEDSFYHALATTIHFTPTALGDTKKYLPDSIKAPTPTPTATTTTRTVLQAAPSASICQDLLHFTPTFYGTHQYLGHRYGKQGQLTTHKCFNKCYNKYFNKCFNKCSNKYFNKCFNKYFNKYFKQS